MCVYVYMYVYVYMCMYICMRMYICVCMYIYVYNNAHMVSHEVRPQTNRASGGCLHYWAT